MKHTHNNPEKTNSAPHDRLALRGGGNVSADADLLARTVILVCGCVGSGKTTLARNVARSFAAVNYFDKDSMATIAAAGASRQDRTSTEFMDTFRDAEMDACVNLILEAIEFCPHLVMSAPWRLELASLFENKPHERIQQLADGCHRHGAKLYIVFINIDRRVLLDHLRRRVENDPAAAARTDSIYSDPDKLDSFLATQILHVPDSVVSLPDVDQFFVFKASEASCSFEDLKKVLSVDFDLPYDPEF